jgi:replication factor A2
LRPNLITPSFRAHQGRGAQTLMPLTVKQLMDASQTNDDKSSFAVNGWEVSTVRISHRLASPLHALPNNLVL